jgi:hypothetical protein
MLMIFDDGTVIRIDEKHPDWFLRVGKGKDGKWKGIDLSTRGEAPHASLEVLTLGTEIKQQLTPYGNPSWEFNPYAPKE